MSFSKTSENMYIVVSGGSTALCAHVRNNVRNYSHTFIDLDEAIGNDDGWFSRKVNGFSQSAEHIKLEPRDPCDPESVTWLVAELSNFDGSQRQRRKINLDLHITNNNGNLEWVPED